MGDSSQLVFFVNGKKILEPTPDPEATLLQYLRRNLHLAGTKEGCGHGGCGSCTVMVSKFDHTTKNISHSAINACLFPLCGAHGLAFTTVEGVGNPRTGLHEVQKRLVKSYGMQCGFCTPGFVMSMFTLLRNNPNPSKDDVEVALEGNLCRCTGYRPILQAFDGITQEACSLGSECCRVKVKPEDSKIIGKDSSHLPDCVSQAAIFPSELQLTNKYRGRTLTFKHRNVTWITPATFKELVELKDKYPDAEIVMGNSSKVLPGLQKKRLTLLLHAAVLPEMRHTEVTKTGISLGAGLTFAELDAVLQSIKTNIDASKTRYFPAFRTMVRRYGAVQIRNSATIGGSVVTNLSNSDLMPLLLALDASLTVVTVKGTTNVRVREGPIKDPRAVIKSINIPYSTPRDVLEFYKQQDRRTFSLGNANAAMLVRFNQTTDVVDDLVLSFGNAKQHLHIITKTGRVVKGGVWDEKLLSTVLNIISEEIIVGNGGHDSTDKGCPKPLASTFFFKFFLTVKKDFPKATSLLQGTNDIPVGADDTLPLPACRGIQLFEPAVEYDQEEHDAVGRPIPNLASESIVSGEAIYLDDIPTAQSELFVKQVLSRKTYAKIKSINPAPALVLPGVKGFISHEDIPGKNAFGTFADEELFASEELEGSLGKSMRKALEEKDRLYESAPLFTKRERLEIVLYFGQPIGAVVAETREIAQRAAELVQVSYGDMQPLIDLKEAIAAESFFPFPPGEKIDHGDVESVFASGCKTLSGEYTTEMQEQFYMEPQSALVIPKVEGQEFEIYAAAQDLRALQNGVCALLDIPNNRITCKVKRLGGAFGGKVRNVMATGPAAIAANKYKRPVRCILSRAEDMLITGKRNPFLAKYKVAYRDDGKIEGLECYIYANAGCSRDLTPVIMNTAIQHIDVAYCLPNAKIECKVCKTNLPSNTAFRGFGVPQVTLIMENIIMKIANALGLEQEQVREINLYKEGDMTPYKQPIVNCLMEDCWDKCIEESKYETRLQGVEQFNRENRWKKKGIACTPLKFGVGFPKFMSQGAALMHIYLDGTVLVSHGGIEMGQGLTTKLTQLASRALGIEMDMIHTSETSTDKTPNTFVTAGSMGTDMYGPAVLKACRDLKSRLLPYMEKNPEGTWKDWVNAAYFEKVSLSVAGFAKLNDRVDGPYDYYTYGACCSEVEIDILTGENQVLRTDIVMDIGSSINPEIDIGQIEGGYVQGLGYVTSEQVVVSDDGRIVNCSPLNYKIPNVRSVPREFNVTILKSLKSVAPLYSAKSAGEPPFLLSISAYMAIQKAVQAARKEIGLTEECYLPAPATVERIRVACGDQLCQIQEDRDTKL